MYCVWKRNKHSIRWYHERSSHHIQIIRGDEVTHFIHLDIRDRRNIFLGTKYIHSESGNLLSGSLFGNFIPVIHYTIFFLFSRVVQTESADFNSNNKQSRTPTRIYLDGQECNMNFSVTHNTEIGIRRLNSNRVTESRITDIVLFKSRAIGFLLLRSWYLIFVRVLNLLYLVQIYCNKSDNIRYVFFL